jgi:ribA/ribD-fused uncharacterized protein
MIERFTGKHRYLSNFWYAPVQTLDGIWVPTNEHAYQYEKSLDPEYRKYISLVCETPAEAKQCGRQVVTLRPDWDELKDAIMEDLIRQKFTIHYNLRTLLINTGDEYLQEGNWHGDAIWGVDLKTGAGQNKLGHLLMKIRKEFQDKLQP